MAKSKDKKSAEIKELEEKLKLARLQEREERKRAWEEYQQELREADPEWQAAEAARLVAVEAERIVVEKAARDARERVVEKVLTKQTMSLARRAGLEERMVEKSGVVLSPEEGKEGNHFLRSSCACEGVPLHGAAQRRRPYALEMAAVCGGAQRIEENWPRRLSSGSSNTFQNTPLKWLKKK